jgi:hypothetical protein
LNNDQLPEQVIGLAMKVHRAPGAGFVDRLCQIQARTFHGRWEAPILKDRINKIYMINRITPNSCPAFSEVTLSFCTAHGKPIGEIL